jgi:glycosyltransferase involved in cell wall biosynthesis
MKNRKLLFVVNSIYTFISHRLPIALKAKEVGYDVHVISPTPEGQEKIAMHGLTHHLVDLSRSGTALISELKGFNQLRKTILQIQPDILHTVAIKSVIYGSIINRYFLKKSCVSAVPGMGYSFLGQSQKQKLFQSMLVNLYKLGLKGKNNTVIFQNQDDKQFFESNRILGNSAVELIKGSGVCLKQFSYTPEPESSKIKVVLPARMLWDKGVGEFIEAAKIIAKLDPQLHFILAGDSDPGNRASITNEQLKVWQQLPNVTWLGHQQNMAAVYQECHIVCLPSYREGMPKALLEAAACGRAVITTDVPGCREAIIPNVSGFLVPVRNVSVLQARLLELAASPELRQQMGKAGRKLAEESFCINSVVNKTLDIYQSALSGDTA